MNWRRPIIKCLLSASGNKIPKILREIRSLEYAGRARVCECSDLKLKKILLHAYDNVPYYRQVLGDCGVVADNEVRLDNLSAVPPLTKQIIQEQGENLFSEDYKSRRPYGNTSGGSTGEPVAFLQDRNYNLWNAAHKMYFTTMPGRQLGQSMIKLWGSERDILGGKDKLLKRTSYYLFNISTLNSFMMSDDVMREYALRWNRIRPSLVWAYASSVLEFGRYIRRTKTQLSVPKAVICTAETLTQEMRSFIESAFYCPVLNQYGSREVGAVACECLHQNMHIFSLHNKLEILDDNLQRSNEGEVYLTTLNNYTMPLIRYRIGDTAVVSDRQCECGRSWPLIEKLTGRLIDHFVTSDGRVVQAEFFIHFVGVVYNDGSLEKFQVIQKDYDHIVIKAVVRDQMKFAESKASIANAIKKTMGNDCRVDFEFVNEIRPSKSGKHIYTICEVK